jgi:hypothetical protein
MSFLRFCDKGPRGLGQTFNLPPFPALGGGADVSLVTPKRILPAKPPLTPRTLHESLLAGGREGREKSVVKNCRVISKFRVERRRTYVGGPVVPLKPQRVTVEIEHLPDDMR